MKLLKIVLIVFLVLLIAVYAVINNRAAKRSENSPIITSDIDEIQVLCQYNKEDLLQGLTAYDVEDGYITDKILIGAFSEFTEPGVSSLEYAVYDSDGNIAVFNRKVVFSDYTPPSIKINTPWVFKATSNAYNMPSLSLEGWDKLDGDISKHTLITSDDVNYAEPGNYTASVYLKNSFGDKVNMDLPIHIIDPGLNGLVIELKEPLIYVAKGASVNPKDYIAAVRNEYTNEIMSDESYKLKIKSDVDTSEDGVYEIRFSAISSDQIQQGETWMTVVVGDFGG